MTAAGLPGLELRHDPEHRIVAADARSHLFVILFGVADLIKLGLSKHRKKKGESPEQDPLQQFSLSSFMVLSLFLKKCHILFTKTMNKSEMLSHRNNDDNLKCQADSTAVVMVM